MGVINCLVFRFFPSRFLYCKYVLLLSTAKSMAVLDIALCWHVLGSVIVGKSFYVGVLRIGGVCYYSLMLIP